MSMDTTEHIRRHFEALSPHLDEKSLRMFVASETLPLGRAGVTPTVQVTGPLEDSAEVARQLGAHSARGDSRREHDAIDQVPDRRRGRSFHLPAVDVRNLRVDVRQRRGAPPGFAVSAFWRASSSRSRSTMPRADPRPRSHRSLPLAPSGCSHRRRAAHG